MSTDDGVVFLKHEFGTMRIFHVVNSVSLQAGGAERLVRSLHDGLRKRGIESVVLSLQTSGDATSDGIIHGGFASPYDPRACWRIVRWLRQSVRHNDIVHAHMFPTALYTSLAGWLWPRRPAFLLTEHSPFNGRRNHALGYAIDAMTYAMFDRIVAISDGVSTALSAARPQVSPRLRVVNNGVKLPYATSLMRSDIGRPTVLSVAGLRHAKNLDGALAALAHIKHLEFDYCIAGSGPELEALSRQAKALCISDRVRFLGHVDDVTPLLESADIFLMPSRWEGFGLAAVEAMNASLPIVAGDVPGLRDVVGYDGKAALLVDPTDTVAIARALETLLASHALRQRLGCAAFTRSLRFDVENMINGYIDTYADLRTMRTGVLARADASR